MTEQSDNVYADSLTAWKTLPMAKATGIVMNAATMEMKKNKKQMQDQNEIGKYLHVLTLFLHRGLCPPLSPQPPAQGTPSPVSPLAYGL